MLLNDKSAQQQAEIIADLNRRRGKIISATGGWFPGKGVFSHSYSMLEELVGEKTYFQILILNATGRLVEKPLADWIEALYGCLSWPDPRIWCNQIGALAGAARTSVMSATAMGSLAADSRIYGVLPLLESVAFIQQALTNHKQGMTPAQIIDNAFAACTGKPYIMGYRRPIAKGDERLVVMEQVGRKLGFTIGEHMLLAYEIEKDLLQRIDEGMNINGYMSAFLADQGFSADECYQMFSMLVASGVTACYLDTYKRPPDTFLPLRCDDIDYQGAAKRPVPTAD
jgi:citrate synthase